MQCSPRYDSSSSSGYESPSFLDNSTVASRRQIHTSSVYEMRDNNEELDGSQQQQRYVEPQHKVEKLSHIDVENQNIGGHQHIGVEKQHVGVDHLGAKRLHSGVEPRQAGTRQELQARVGSNKASSPIIMRPSHLVGQHSISAKQKSRLGKPLGRGRALLQSIRH